MTYKTKKKKVKMPTWTKREKDWYAQGYFDAQVGNKVRHYKLKK